ncbi:hypothetical protein CSC03_1820 [Enterobacter hormaechei]|nr:hypothetical protein CSC03_1820 [Enterobacter hormaechei]
MLNVWKKLRRYYEIIFHYFHGIIFSVCDFYIHHINDFTQMERKDRVYAFSQ